MRPKTAARTKRMGSVDDMAVCLKRPVAGAQLLRPHRAPFLGWSAGDQLLLRPDLEVVSVSSCLVPCFGQYSSSATISSSPPLPCAGGRVIIPIYKPICCTSVCFYTISAAHRSTRQRIKLESTDK